MIRRKIWYDDVQKIHTNYFATIEFILTPAFKLGTNEKRQIGFNPHIQLMHSWLKPTFVDVKTPA